MFGLSSFEITCIIAGIGVVSTLIVAILFHGDGFHNID